MRYLSFSWIDNRLREPEREEALTACGARRHVASERARRRGGSGGRPHYRRPNRALPTREAASGTPRQGERPAEDPDWRPAESRLVVDGCSCSF